MILSLNRLMLNFNFRRFVLLALVLTASSLRADHDSKDLPAGHSAHGDAFNEGPRQKAVLMPGQGAVHFPITTRVPLAQKFFDQGVGQLHGFFYFEAERSFRQTVALDTNCAIAYWGMAMANLNNTKRAKEFILKAEKLKSGAGAREVRWIDSLANYYREEKRDEKERRKQYTKALEQIVKDYPDDIEAKALLAVQMYQNNSKGVPYGDKKNVDVLLNAIFAAQPMHPAHHYRIHLWDDGPRATNALVSAASCGPSEFGIAHMWHMSGHTYSALKRYADAAWQQEASARVDHAYMMENRVLPDQIHNFAHNNEWLIRDLNNIGAVRRAVDLAKNMIELPRHPKFNTTSKGSSSYGYQRLLETLVRYELWDEVLALSNTIYLQPTDNNDHEARRFHALGLAAAKTGDLTAIRNQIIALENLKKKIAAKPPEKKAAPGPEENKPEAGTPAESRPEAGKAGETLTGSGAGAPKAVAKSSGTKQPLPASKSATKAPASNAGSGGGAPLLATSSTNSINNAIAELNMLLAWKADRNASAREQLDKLKDIPKERLARHHLNFGDRKKAEQLAQEVMKAAPNQVQPLAAYIETAHANGNFKSAYESFYKLRDLSAEVDLDAPVFRRLASVAKDLKLGSDWRPPLVRAPDFGKRPALASLGPVRWQPSPAPDWSLADANGRKLSLRQYRGKPVVVIFYLGAGCPHCIEQIAAFVPLADDFAAAGISLVAVSTDSPGGLHETWEKAKSSGGLPFPLVSDQSLKTFKAYRAFDDFENQPLHGTFLIDGDGLVRWQDISFQPFMQTDFLLAETKRLLGLPNSRNLPHPLRFTERSNVRPLE
jgi:peroxiredoxin